MQERVLAGMIDAVKNKSANRGVKVLAGKKKTREGISANKPLKYISIDLVEY
jgi:hypothetical protein